MIHRYNVTSTTVELSSPHHHHLWHLTPSLYTLILSLSPSVWLCQHKPINSKIHTVICKHILKCLLTNTHTRTHTYIYFFSLSLVKHTHHNKQPKTINVSVLLVNDNVRQGGRDTHKHTFVYTVKDLHTRAIY